MWSRIAGLVILGFSLSTSSADAAEALPFEVDHHRVFISVSVGESEPLRLFLDTGLPFPGIFLFHEDSEDLLAGVETLDVMVPGAGSGDPTPGIMAEDMTLRIGSTELGGQRVIVSRGEHTQQFLSDGIIGASLFERFAVELDYASLTMTLHERGGFDPDSEWTALPLELKKGIPWVQARLALRDGPLEPLSVYIDFADHRPLTLLTGPGRRFAAPDSLPAIYLGTGLSGDVHGSRGRVARLGLGPHVLENVSTDYAPAGQRSKQYGSEGILGCGLLERFHVVFDYEGLMLYLKPNECFPEPFE